MDRFSRNRTLRVLTILRDGWTVIGISLALLLALEGAYRLQGAVRRTLRPRPASQQGFSRLVRRSLDHPDSPYYGQAWWPEFLRAREGHVLEGGGVRYDPYRAWSAKPGTSPSLVIDSLGHRRTIHPGGISPARRRKVFMLGGSTMWGFTASDSMTIPALVAARLPTLGVQDVEVVNLSQSGYNATQGLISLLLRIRAGERPAAVVFLDGVNEVGVVSEGGHPGDVYEHARFARTFEGGIPPVRQQLAQRLALIRRLGALFGRQTGSSPSVALTRPDCHRAATYYANLARMGHELGRGLGYQVLYVWQPTLANTRKPLTPWERYAEGRDRPLAEAQATCKAIVDSSMAAEPEIHFVDMATLFDRDTTTVFFDQWGHLVEQEGTRVAKAIADSLVYLLAAPR